MNVWFLVEIIEGFCQIFLVLVKMSMLNIIFRSKKCRINIPIEPIRLKIRRYNFLSSIKVNHINYHLHTFWMDKLYSHFNVRYYCNIVENTNKPLIKEGMLTKFMLYGFKDSDINTLISSCPDIIRLTEEKLNKVLQCWTQCDFGTDCTVSLILNHPNLMFVQSKQIERLYVYLASNFTKNDVYKIFLTAPQLLIENIDRIDDKLIYLEREFTISKTQIAKSGALRYSLHHIKERLEFLTRLGLYKKMHDKKKGKHVNHRLDIIVCTSDEEFATKVAGVSLLEYEVFQELFAREVEEGLD